MNEVLKISLGYHKYPQSSFIESHPSWAYPGHYILNAMIELTMSFPFSFSALTALFLETFA